MIICHPCTALSIPQNSLKYYFSNVENISGESEKSYNMHPVSPIKWDNSVCNSKSIETRCYKLFNQSFWVIYLIQGKALVFYFQIYSFIWGGELCLKKCEKNEYSHGNTAITYKYTRQINYRLGKKRNSIYLYFIFHLWSIHFS